MYEFDLVSLQNVLDRTYQVETGFNSCRDADADVEKVHIDNAKSVVTEAQALCQQEGFDDCLEVIAQILVAFEYETRDFSTMAAELRHLRGVLFNDVQKRAFVQIRPARRWWTNDMNFLGDKVASAFPSAVEDIYEAGNCLAVELHTAGVFHLMRVVEYGLRALCVDLGLRRSVKRTKSGKKKYTPIPYADWETMLNQLQDKVDAKIEKMKRGQAKQVAQEFYYPILQDVRGIRDAWRNHVMHSRAHYIREDADAILAHVKRLMGRLALKVSEQ